MNNSGGAPFSYLSFHRFKIRQKVINPIEKINFGVCVNLQLMIGMINVMWPILASKEEICQDLLFRIKKITHMSCIIAIIFTIGFEK